MNEILQSLARSIENDGAGVLIPIIAIGGGIFMGIIGWVTHTIQSVTARAELEKSRREIAAYVAEGSMSPEQAEALLNAGDKAARRASRGWCG